VVSKLAAAEALVVLDNCEHLADVVATFVERLLRGCFLVTVLATSRVRLLVPHETVFPVPGMSLDADAGRGDAVELFIQRAAMAGWSSAYDSDRGRIARICDELDGVALSIELAAARMATLGIDGLETGLTDQLSLLSGGPRLDGRHRSARSALDWSYGLLDETDRMVLCRASVFTSPFTAAAAATVAAAPLLPGQVAGALARLADHNLLVTIAAPGETRYRMLETIRQYGTHRLEEAGELDDVLRRHLAWCLATAARLESSEASSQYKASFLEVADDLRSALRWAGGLPEHRAGAFDLATLLARLTYARGMPSESQERYEQAATLAPGPAEAAAASHLAGVVAWGRHLGNAAIRLFRAAADAALEARDARRAALELLNAAEIMTNAPGIMSELPAPGAAHALLDEARSLAAGDVHVEASILTVTTPTDEFDPAYADLAERAVELAHRVGDARLESHALDQVTAVCLVSGQANAAVATVRRRLELVQPRADDVEMAWEHSDTLHMAPLACLAAGDLRAAREYAQARSELPFLREADHLAVEWLLPTSAIAGDLDDAVAYAERFRRGWTEAGRPALGGIAFAPAAAAMAYGIRGDQDAHVEWLEITRAMRRVTEPMRGRETIYSPAFEGMVALHQGDIDGALKQVAGAPESFKPWHDAAWRPWYTAVWAEAAVLAGHPDRRSRIDRARFIARENPIASAIIDRADAIDSGDVDRLLAAADALHDAGCHYQQARTLVLAGSEARTRGESILASIGATPTGL
jgi:predicted ATPase